MAEDQVEEDEAAGVEEEAAEKPKGGLKRLAPLILAPLLLGGGGFYAAYSGMIGGGSSPEAVEEEEAKPAAPVNEVAFMQLDEMVVPLAPTARSRILVFGASLEVEPEALPEIEKLRPRLMDVLNTYLRVVDHEALEDPSAMPLLRARLLRRLSVVAAPVEPRD
ncbi:MAG: flagellar basal body-associated FliL family protein, partial [Pseudomonadota bacterium]